ncbi:MAG: stage sporulation protein [Candidatus Acidoferrum typicum]|nr:stage sporulation protein [Candidatus Acidoferrum typicum]
MATFVLPGQSESGDRHLVCCQQSGILIAVIDGIGHGEEAGVAAKAAVSLLKARADEQVISLVQKCHENLRMTRGVVLSLASIDPLHGMMTWIGVGNVQGALMRTGASKGIVEQELLLRAGVVGSQLPPLQAAVLPIAQGDTMIFATDGVKSEFVKSLSALEAPQRAADRILEQYCRGNDDALVLVARLTGIRP